MLNTGIVICGGGDRGVIPCLELASLEDQTGKLTRDVVQYISGCSTGALLAAAVAAGIPAKDLVKIYTDRSKEIFTPTGVIAKSKRFAMGFMYEPTHLQEVLISVFGDKAAWKVNDSPIPICISAVAMNGHDWFFVKDGPRNAGTTGTVGIIDAAICSAVAPTFHDHWKINIGGKDMRFFDGGVGGLSNPTYQTAVEMFEYDKFNPGNTQIVTLGTGYFPASDDPPSGILDVIRWTTSTMVDTAQDWVDQATERQWPGLAQKFDVLLPRDISEDDLSAIPLLLKIGQEAAAKMDWSKILNGKDE